MKFWHVILDLRNIQRFIENPKVICSLNCEFSPSSTQMMEAYASSTGSSSSDSLRSISTLTSSGYSSTADLSFESARCQLDGDVDFVLVVGGLGFIGSHTTLELLKEGHNVVVVDDLSNSFRGVLSRITSLAQEHCLSTGKKLPYLRFHHCDYRSSEMRSVLKQYSTHASLLPSRTSSTTLAQPRRSRITGVIQFAAYKSVEESIHSPLQYYQNNVCGLVDFLLLLKEHGITNLVFSSSATVYGDKTNDGFPLLETDLIHHPESDCSQDGQQIQSVPGVKGLTSPYGRTKYFCEAILADVAKADSSWKITALRYFNPVGCHESGLLGEDPRQKPTNLFPIIAQVLSGTRPALEIFGSDWDTVDGTPVRDFIHVTDLARGHIAAVSSREDQKPFRAYNLGSGTGSTVAQAVASFEAAASREIPVLRVGRRAGDVGSCVAGTERVEAELGWKAEKTLHECARDTWNFICKSKEGVS
jgi:UDP-glucose 4-epimerase